MPVERVVSSFARLLEIRVLHHYWLDDGSTIFDDLAADVQERRLLNYDVRDLFDVRPTPDSERIIAGLQGVWRQTSLGIVVGVPAAKQIADDLELEFTLCVRDLDLLEYTAYGLDAPSSADAFQTTTKKRFRYRANAARYSNLTGASRGTGASKELFLAREYVGRTAADRVEYLVDDSGALVQLTSDPPASASVVLDPAASTQPVYAHHGDVAALVAPPDIEGTVPSHGIEVPRGADPDVHALITIHMQRPDDSDFSCTAASVAKETAPLFQLRFKNRRTLWRYLSKNKPSTALSESGPFPLTYLGNPTTTKKPPRGGVKLDVDDTLPNSPVTNIVSEVFT